MLELDWSIWFINFIWAAKEVVAMSVFLIASVVWLAKKNWWPENFLPKVITLFIMLWLIGVMGYLFFQLGLTSPLPPSWLPFFDDDLVFWFLVITLGGSLPVFWVAILSHHKLYSNI